MPEYDLRYKPWIPVGSEEGVVRKVGLKELFERAHEFARVEGANPIETVSLLRLLVGITHHLIGEVEDPREWGQHWAPERFDTGSVAEYFEQSPWASGFDLFHEENPFWQCARLKNLSSENGQERPISVKTLLLEVPGGNNRTLFAHYSDSKEFRLDPDQAARTAVTAQFFSLSGLNKKHTNRYGYQQSFFHASFVQGMPSIVAGATLRDTLLLNSIPRAWRGPGVAELPLGLPPWASAQPGNAESAQKAPASYLEIVLPQSRHVRLVPEVLDDGSLSVARMHIAQGVSWDPAIEPWFVKRKVAKKDDPPNAIQLQLERAAWRSSSAYLGWHSRDGKYDYVPPDNLQVYPLLRQAARRTRPLPPVARLEVRSLANDKAKPLAWREELLVLPAEALSDRTVVRSIDSALGVAEACGQALSRAVERFYREVERSPEFGRESPPARKAARDATLRRYWAHAGDQFTELLLQAEDYAGFTARCIQLASERFQTFIQRRSGSDVRSFPARAIAERQLFATLTRLRENRKQEVTA